jgi:beta-mannanase
MWNVFQATQVNGQSLNNFLIWVYNVNQDQGGYTSYFPGTAYCDMTSGDAYSQVSWDPNGGQPYPAATLAQFEQKVSTFYSALKSLGLPVGFGECGLATNTYNQMYSNPNNFTQDSTQYINAIRNQAPGISFFLVFCGGWAINSQNNASALLNDAWVVNLADIPAGLN